MCRLAKVAKTLSIVRELVALFMKPVPVLREWLSSQAAVNFHVLKDLSSLIVVQTSGSMSSLSLGAPYDDVLYNAQR